MGEPSGTEKCPVALQWQSGKQLAKWLSIGKIDPYLGSVAVDWSKWHPSGTVALDWLPIDMFYICVKIAAELHYFGTKAYYYPRPPPLCQQCAIK